MLPFGLHAEANWSKAGNRFNLFYPKHSVYITLIINHQLFQIQEKEKNICTSALPTSSCKRIKSHQQYKRTACYVKTFLFRLVVSFVFSIYSVTLLDNFLMIIHSIMFCHCCWEIWVTSQGLLNVDIENYVYMFVFYWLFISLGEEEWQTE